MDTNLVLALDLNDAGVATKVARYDRRFIPSHI